MKKITGFTLLAIAFLMTSAQAQDSTTCSGLLLKNHISVAAEGMGGAQTALEVDGTGAHDFNPAGLGGSEYPRVSASYYSGLVDDAFGAISFDMPYEAWTLGASFIYYDAGVMELVTLDGDISQVSAQKDMLLSLTGARWFSLLGQPISVGANIKVLNSTLVEEYTATAFAGDLGVRYEIKPLVENLHLGLAIKNIGTPLTYIETADALPAYALAGLSYGFSPDSSVAILVAGDVNYDLENKIKANVGAQVTVFDLVSLRGGYKLGYDIGAITAGIGVEWTNFRLDYAFNVMEVMNTVHRVSLGYKLAPLPFLKKETQEAEEIEEPVQTVDDMVDTMHVTSKPEGEMEKLQAKVLEIRRVGGMVKEVVMNLGSNHGVKIGYAGSILDPNGVPLAGIVIRVVDAEVSLAEVQGLSKDIDSNVWAIIERPIGK
jgi:hypothetical protein